MLFEIENLHFHYDEEKPILKGVSLNLGAGEFVVIAGANGSGKTVLMKHLNGLLKPVSGKVLFKGEEISSMALKIKKQVGLVFQSSDAQIVGQTVYDEIAFGPRNLGFKKEEVHEVVMSVSEAFGITEILDAQPHFLSGGEKKRVTIAGVVVMNPEVVVLDEPFAGLDYPGVRSVAAEIVAMHRRGHTVIVITHDLEKILAHAQRMIILNDGVVSYDGKPSINEKLYRENSLRHPYGKNRKRSTYTWGI